MKRVLSGVLIIGLLIGMVPLYAAHAASPCTLCILEISTQGLHGEEDQDFVVIGNVGTTKISTSGLQLRYFTDKGLQANSIGIGSSFEPGQLKMYASKPLADLNTGITNTFDFGLYSAGGGLQIVRAGSTTTIYDKVGWGSGLMAETTPIAAAPAGTTIARKRLQGVPQDSDNNASDFEFHEASCRGIEISEVQPFVADPDGQATEAWVELVGGSDMPGDCLLTTKQGDAYMIPAVDMPKTGEIKVINRGLDAQGQVVLLRPGEMSGQIWFNGISAYPDANGALMRIPFATVAYTNIKNGQSWALVEGLWRRTYSLTPGESNIYQPDPSIPDDDPRACADVRISELLPNPKGEDGGQEWIEITNESDSPVQLAQCQIVIAGEAFRFLSDDMLGPHEWRVSEELFNADETPKTLTLRNSGEVSVLLQRLRANGTAETIQSFVYKDAPEGQSWARFTSGWRWETVPTPNMDNATPPPADSNDAPTEFPESPIQPGIGVNGFISITELLPNPSAPQTDDNDEFIELYNASDEPISLAGYTLQAGNSYTYSVTLTDQVVPAKGYFVLTSGNSSISLANSGGRARLLSPSEEVISETIPYVDAGEGNAWALIGGIWQWTARPTPGADNQASTPVLSGLSKTKSTSASAKKASTAVKSARKTASPKSPKASSAATTKPAHEKTETVAAISPIHPVVLAVVGCLAVLYAAYEYRQDIANRIYQFRRNRSRR